MHRGGTTNPTSTPLFQIAIDGEDPRALARNVTGAGIPDINARYPRRLPLEPTWVGVSDHDPVLVDVRLTQSSTSD